MPTNFQKHMGIFVDTRLDIKEHFMNTFHKAAKILVFIACFLSLLRSFLSKLLSLGTYNSFVKTRGLYKRILQTQFRLQIADY